MQTVEQLVRAGYGSALLPAPPPGSRSSPQSLVKAWGKTPGVVGSDGLARGFHGWPQHVSSANDIATWFTEPGRHSVCVNARDLAAIDIDIEDAVAVSRILKALGEISETETFAVRARSNSARVLVPLALKISGKHIYRTLAGAVEILGAGCQWLAGGMHTSGVAYALTDAPFLSLTSEQLGEFGRWLKREGFSSERVAGPSDAPPDHVREFLASKGVIKHERPGVTYIRCPFEHEHSGESSETATAYFHPYTKGRAEGAIKCLHAHCAKRHKNDFLLALGYDFPELSDAPRGLDPAPKRVKVTALHDATILVSKLSAFNHDTFSDRMTRDSSELNDSQLLDLRAQLSARNYELPKELTRDACVTVARKNTSDALSEWVRALEWDGTPRVDSFLSSHAGAELTPYTAAASRYFWSALVARATHPGAKADMTIVLAGAEGAGKSTLVSSCAPWSDAFTELDLSLNDADLSRQTLGVCVAELSELRGVSTRTGEHLKSWLTRRVDDWVPKYQEFAVRRPRRFVCVGTTNDARWRSAALGARRWLPIAVVRGCEPLTDVLRAQFWAEAREAFQGVVMYADAERLARHELSASRDVDPFEAILEACGSRPTLAQAWELLGVPVAQRTSGMRRRVEAALLAAFD
jgi:hypothetical protein